MAIFTVNNVQALHNTGSKTSSGGFNENNVQVLHGISTGQIKVQKLPSLNTAATKPVSATPTVKPTTPVVNKNQLPAMPTALAALPNNLMSATPAQMGKQLTATKLPTSKDKTGLMIVNPSQEQTNYKQLYATNTPIAMKAQVQKTNNYLVNEVPKNPIGAAVLQIPHDFGVDTILAKATGDTTYEQAVANAQKEHPVASTLGMLAGYAVPGAGVDALITKAAAPIVAKIAVNTAGKILSKATINAISNAALMGASGILQGQSGEQVAKDMALNAAAGGVLGSIGPVLKVLKDIKVTRAVAKIAEEAAKAEKVVPVENSGILKNVPRVAEGTSNPSELNEAANSVGAKSITPEGLQSMLADNAEKGKGFNFDNNFKNVVGKSDKYSNKDAQAIIDRASNEENVNKAKTNDFAKDTVNTVKNIEDRQAVTIRAEMSDKEIAESLKGRDAQTTDIEDLLKTLKEQPKTPENDKLISDGENILAKLEKRIPEKIANLDREQNIDGVMTTPRKLLLAAQNLKGDTLATAQNATEFTGKLGEIGVERQILDHTTPNYLRHEWESPDINSVDTKKLEENRLTALENKKTLKVNGGSGININKERVYKNYITGMLNGETPKTLDVARLVSKTGNDMARRLSVQGFLDDIVRNNYATESDRVFKGYTAIGLSKDGIKIQLPKSFASALRPIWDENYGKAYGGKVWNILTNRLKMIKLGFSAFHYKNLFIAAMNDGDMKPVINFIKALPHAQEYMRSNDFRSWSYDMIHQGGMTSAVESNLDTGRALTQSETRLGTVISAVSNMPGIKQAGKFMDKNNEILFEDMQSIVKVLGYKTKVTIWLAKHPGATLEQINAAKSGIAKHLNGVFGGLNWKSLRVPKQILGVMRMVMLAPDWTFSNINVAWNALKIGNVGTNAVQARMFFARNFIYGVATLEALNYAFTGHGTWMNPKGHELEVEISPGVYFTPLDGFMKDAATLTGDIVKNSTLGPTQFAESKLNPLASTILGIAKQTNYYGQSLIDKNGNPLKTMANEASFAGQQLAPVPFGATGIYNYLKDPNAKKTPLDVGLIGTGLGRYSSDAPPNPAEPQAGNWLYDLTPQGRQEASAQAAVTSYKQQKTANSTSMKSDVAKAVKAGQAVNAQVLATKYKIPIKTVMSEIKTARSNTKVSVYSNGTHFNITSDTTKYPTLLKSFASIAKADQKNAYNNLTTAQKRTLDAQIKALTGS
jgi:hypothetical protein